MKKIIISLLTASLLFVSACHSDSGIKPEIYNNMQGSHVSDTIVDEVDSMKREFCVVMSLQDDYFTIKNVLNERYNIDNSFLADFKVGDEVLLIYTERRSIGEGIFEAEVQAVYPDDSTLVYPAN